MSVENIGNCIVNSVERGSEYLRIQKKRIGEYVNLYKKRRIILAVKLSKEQKKAIDSLWIKNYGKKIPYYWHRLYTSYTGVFDPLYFPEIMYSTKIEPKFNSRFFSMAYEDKAQLDIILKESNGVNTIRTIVGRSNGVFFDSQHALLSATEAALALYDIGRVVMKPTIDTDSGNNVLVLDCARGIDKKSGKQIETIFADANYDFVIQEYVIPHETMRLLYGECINTLRIVTYILNNKVFHCPVAMRIGSGGAKIDNIHAGGLGIAISDEGLLEKWAFKEYGEKIEAHPDSGIVFKNYQIPSVPEAIALVERLHMRFPRLAVISWDVTINEGGTPIIVEMNTRNQAAWFPQMASGKNLFGNNTEEMIKLCRKK